jgi:hypothetical protein
MPLSGWKLTIGQIGIHFVPVFFLHLAGFPIILGAYSLFVFGYSGCTALVRKTPPDFKTGRVEFKKQSLRSGVAYGFGAYRSGKKH